KGDKSTQELFQEVDQARKQGQASRSEPSVPVKPASAATRTPLPKGDPRNLPALVAATKAWLAGEEQRLAQAEAALKAEGEAARRAKAAQVAHTKEALRALIRRVDPELRSPMTRAVLESEARFLRDLGVEAKELGR